MLWVKDAWGLDVIEPPVSCLVLRICQTNDTHAHCPLARQQALLLTPLACAIHNTVHARPLEMEHLWAPRTASQHSGRPTSALVSVAAVRDLSPNC